MHQQAEGGGRADDTQVGLPLHLNIGARSSQNDEDINNAASTAASLPTAKTTGKSVGTTTTFGF